MSHTERTLKIPGMVLASIIHDLVASDGDVVRIVILIFKIE
jgi:hypothetical protein